MFYTKKVKDEIEKRQDIFFDVIMDTIELKIAESRQYGHRETIELRNDLMDLITAFGISLGAKPKKIADSYQLERLEKFQKDLLVETNRRIEEEKVKIGKSLTKIGVKNAYDKVTGQKTPKKV